jgi:hypothetical protein
MAKILETHKKALLNEIDKRIKGLEGKVQRQSELASLKLWINEKWEKAIDDIYNSRR